jgi:Kef-type K+ transport system membrane component KefB
MQEISFEGLAIVAVVGFLVPLVLGFFPKLRVPSVVVEIAAGAVIGPSILGWVHMDEPIRIFSRLGMASLLFLAGLEMEIDRLRGGLLRTALLGILISLAISAAFCYTLQAFGVLQSPLFVTIMLASSAIGIVIPLLKDAGEMGTPFGQAIIVGMSVADFGTVLLLTLLFSAGGGGRLKTLVLLGMVGVLCLLIVAAASRLGRWERLSKTLERLQDTTAMIRIRGAAMLLILFVVLVQHIGLELMLGAFAAGALLGYVDRDWQTTHPQFQMRLQAVGFGVFIPAFFVASGIQLDFSSLTAGGSTLVLIPVFFVGLVLIRGVPALVYRKLVGPRLTVVAGLLQAISLPLLVAGASIGLETGRMSETTAAGIISAGMLSMLFFPSAALVLLQKKL